MCSLLRLTGSGMERSSSGDASCKVSRNKPKKEMRVLYLEAPLSSKALKSVVQDVDSLEQCLIILDCAGCRVSGKPSLGARSVDARITKRSKIQMFRKIRERWNYWRAFLLCLWLCFEYVAQEEEHGQFDYYTPNFYRGYEPCLRPFLTAPECEDGVVWSVYKCGLGKGHDHNCAWRGDLPGGRVWSAK